MAEDPAPRKLMQAATIRRRCEAVSNWVSSGQSTYWEVQPGRLDEAAATVATLTRTRFPDLKVPFHSRWRHFETGGLDRPSELSRALRSQGIEDSSIEALLARIDLCVVSVLLDAGSGPDWRYNDTRHQLLSRSEGLGVASFDAFMAGQFANSPTEPLCANAQRLMSLDQGALGQVFQVSDSNPLAGLDGRLALLNRLGQSLLETGAKRVADIYRPLLSGTLSGSGGGAPNAKAVLAGQLLETTVGALAPVWLKASQAPDGSRGDLWPHPAAVDQLDQADHSQGWVPFHKLSQWLCYSLIEPLQNAGLIVAELESLTGLPEYRNGGLLFDCGVIRLRDPDLVNKVWSPDDRLVIEWRALTVSLLDELAVLVRDQLGMNEQDLPLASILEGGTWSAGRQLAQHYRAGLPPLSVDTAGSVF